MAYSAAFCQSISVVVFIAIKMESNKCDYLTTKHISEVLEIPHSTVRKILKQLTMGGIIKAREGAKGGVLLTNPPEKITLLDIFTAIEQKRPLFKTYSVPLDDKKAKIIEKKVHNVLSNSETQLKTQLGAVTITDLLNS